MDSAAASGMVISPVGLDAVSQTSFYVLTWVFFALCNIAFFTRSYIRYATFRRFLLEDYFMLFALVLHNVEAVLIQLFVGYSYDMEAVEKGDYSKYTPNFFTDSKKGFIALGTSINITMVGVFIVKLNFLLFFRRLGNNIPKFNIVWWSVLLFTLAVTAAQIGMQEFGCFFGSVDYIFGGQHCTDQASLKRIVFNAIFSATADAISDLLIIIFPVAILWRSKITIQKKLVLTFVFSLVFLTIAITIVRGSIFHTVYDSKATGVGQMQSATFTWFWFYMEFSVAFIIACIVSFRTLFVQRERNSRARYEEQQLREAAYRSAIRRGWRARAQQMHDSLLDTCKSLEGWSGSEADSVNMHGLPGVPSGLMTVDFGNDTNWSRTVEDSDRHNSIAKSSVDRSSAASMVQTPEPTHVHAIAR